MALVVASDVYLNEADSYVSVADADTYHARLQNDNWFLIDNVTKESLLCRASIMIDARYARKWKTPEVPYVVVPTSLKRATAELALHGITEDIPRGQERGVKSVSVGPISVEFDPSTESIVSGDGTVWDYIEFLLSPIVTASSTAGGYSWGLLSVSRS